MLNRTMRMSVITTLSTSLLFTTPTYAKPPFRAEQSIENKIDSEMVHKKLKMDLINGTSPIQEQYKKDKAESDRIKAEKEAKRQLEIERKKQEEINKQKQFDNRMYCNYNNISEISNMSTNKIYNLISDTTFNTWEIAQEIKNAESLETPVNALFIISLFEFESWYGKSDLANKNNISSWRLKDGSWRSFNSKLECVKATIKLISEQYLNPKGSYYNGKSIYDIGIYYCEGNIWSGKIIEQINQNIKQKC